MRGIQFIVYLVNVLLVNLLFQKQYVLADPFTYQNDARVVQIKVLNILTGSYATSCATATSPQTFYYPVTFASAFTAQPQVALSIVQVKGTNQNLIGFSVQAPTSKITTTGFQILINCQLNVATNQLVTLKVQYLATILDNVEIFDKSYSSTTLAPLSTGSMYRSIDDQITFTKPKTQIPRVYAFLTGFSLTKGTDKRFIIKAEVTSIKLTQFTLTLSTNLLCSCSSASVQILSFWATESSDALLPTTTNNDARKDPSVYQYYGFYSDYLNTNQTAISVFYGISQFDLGTFNPTTPLIGPDTAVEVEIQTPTFTGKEYYFQVGSTSGTRNYETFLPWVIFLLKRCPTNEYLHSSYLCSVLCPFGTFKEIVKFIGVCTNCHITCKECTGSLANQCTSCEYPSRTLSTSTCICSPGYYSGTIPSQLCSQCNYKCETCLNSADNCQSCTANRELTSNCGCPKGYWDQGVFEICPSCYRTCSECINGDYNQCTSCKVGYQMENGSCICPKGYFDDLTKNQCNICHASCETCNGGTDQDCLTCKADLFRQIVQGRQCLCMVGYHEENLKCVVDAKITCVPYCDKCQDTKVCLVCQAGRELIANACLCPQGFYHNVERLLCLQCHQNCKGCSGPSEYECTSCNSDRVLDKGMCNSTSSSNDKSVNVALLVVVCVLAVLLVILIPFLMRWTYYMSRKIWLRKRALAEFLDGRAKEREQRLKLGQGDIVVLDPIVITDPGDDSVIGNLDQSGVNESILKDQSNRIKSPQLLPLNNKNSDMQVFSPASRNPHLQILSPSSNMNSTMRMNDQMQYGSDMRSPQNYEMVLSPQNQSYQNTLRNPQSNVPSSRILLDPYANTGAKRLPKLNKQIQ